MADKYVLAIDQGTTSSRAIIFDHSGKIVSVGQKEHEQIFPRAGWVEHNPVEVWDNVRAVVAEALSGASINHQQIAAVGITNQRETTVVWDKKTGEPVYNAIVWQDTRTAKIVDELGGGDQDKYKDRVGLPLATYFCGPKVKWILDNVEGARERAEAGDLVMGTMDTWVLWNMTGGVDGGVHVTDVTNASRTMLMDLKTLDWDADIAADMTIPMSMLPEIKSSAEVYGVGRSSGMLPDVPIAGILGDQQAATFGQACFEPGMAKNTYGTGNFMLLNTGEEIVPSKNGLLTTVCYKIGDKPAIYALEGSIAVTGSLVQWLRDNLKMISSAPEVEELAATVEDNGGAYFVPAFSGLFAPYWKSDARGALVGLTRYVNRGHIARAVLEATAYQTREVLEAMEADSGVKLAELKVDGGMTANETLMQFQADQLGVDVVRPVVAETTALGAAYAAGIATGYWQGEQDVIDNWAEDKRWTPKVDETERDRLFRNWKKAVTRTFDWVDEDVKE
ncbi:glycerol kinase [Tessaracoccus lapidicaptus]|uniref:Glycerol kinase n=1 Tax=Tessaracoccus lapidicaptus TaxID=1427523 RepID=A0A1C0AIQ7_9ACTN|nr:MULTISPECIES: glycerol kinase GlpK [Tessaracoccus]AQX15733.1 glycerol kinase [Tessaracoccus sp. T2.5-30]OCL32012.1 glycerol kinase [Tessaracoccus lapidicaptus]VEP40132.1 Glycerol kinase [Tessaracoccus lapidicaptus]